MKLHLLIVGILAPVFAHADLVEYWTAGVSREEGWSDFNKVSPNSNDGDNNLCWAASASNILNWWQTRYGSPAGTPKGEEIWTTFKNSFTDSGGNSYYAFEWWLEGTYTPTGWKDWSQKKSTAAAGGYYKEYLEYSVWGGERYSSYLAYSDAGTSAKTTSDIVGFLNSGAGLTLSVADTAGETAHAITLWGVEYNTETNLISKMWLTDSDDNQYGRYSAVGLFEVACYNVEVQTESGETQTLLGFRTTENDWYDRTEKDFYITELSGLNPASFAIPVPEPSAFGFLAGLAALAFAGTHRSRKSFKK